MINVTRTNVVVTVFKNGSISISTDKFAKCFGTENVSKRFTVETFFPMSKLVNAYVTMKDHSIPPTHLLDQSGLDIHRRL